MRYLIPFLVPGPLPATRCNLGRHGRSPAARLGGPHRHGRCRMGPLRAQAVGHVHGTKHRAWHPSSRDGCQPGPHCRTARADCCAHTKEALNRVLDIYTWAYASAPSFMYVDMSSCSTERSINVLETGIRHRTPTHPLRRRWPAASAPTVTDFPRNSSVITSASSLASVRTRTMP